MQAAVAEEERNSEVTAMPVWPLDRDRDLTTTAYERIEELFVSMRIAPGQELRTQDLQRMTGIGRTPVHQAVRRLAAETLLEIRPRNGLRVTPIDLTREKGLAELRRDLDRFVTVAAIRNMTANDRAALQHLKRRLESESTSLGIDAFNAIDKSFDRLLIKASGERFLDRVVSPLHAIARRIGYLNLTRLSGPAGLADTIDRHVAIMEHVLNAREDLASAASDELVRFSIAMLEEIEHDIDPALLDLRFAALEGNTATKGTSPRAGSSQT